MPGEFHGQRSLVGYSSWGGKESDTIERLTLSLAREDILVWETPRTQESEATVHGVTKEWDMTEQLNKKKRNNLRIRQSFKLG